MRKNIWVSLLCIIFLVLFFDNVSSQDRKKRSSRMPRWKGPEVGTVLKDFSLKTVAGENYKLSDSKGQVVVFIFGACT